MPTPTGPQVFNTLIMSGKETGLYGVPTAANLVVGMNAATGQYATTAIYHWVTEPSFQPRALRHIPDEGFRGVAGQDFDLIPGPGNGTVGFGGMVYLDSFPHILQNMMGTDQVGTVVNSGYTHQMTAATTPASYTYQWAQGIQAYQFPGTRLTSIRLSFNASDGALTYQAQGTSKLGVALATNPLTTGAAHAVGYEYPLEANLTRAAAGWQGLMVIDGTVAGSGGVASVMEGELTFSRQLTPIHSLNGTQDVSLIYAGPLQVQGRLTLDWYDSKALGYFEGNSANALGAVSNPVRLQFTLPSTATGTATGTASIAIAVINAYGVPAPCVVTSTVGTFTAQMVGGTLTIGSTVTNIIGFTSATSVTVSGGACGYYNNPASPSQTAVASASYSVTYSNRTLAISMQKAAWRQVDIERSGAIYTQVGNITALYTGATWGASATPGDTGPCKVTVVNGYASQY